MTIKKSIESEWTYREFITVLLSLDRSTETQKYLEWLLKNQNSTVVEKYRHREKEAILSLGKISSISKITSYLSESIPSYTKDKKLSIVFWMRVGLHLGVRCSENIDGLINTYCQWKNAEGRDFVLISKTDENGLSNSSYSFDAFISRGAFSDRNKAIPKEEWKIIKAEILEIKPKKNRPQDPYRGIGKFKYLELQRIMGLAIDSRLIKNLRPATGPNGICEYNNTREELHKELIEKYKITLTINSFKKAIPDFAKCYPNKNMPKLTNKKDVFLHKQAHKKENNRKKTTSLDNIKRLSE